jgi:hypothetical protein
MHSLCCSKPRLQVRTKGPEGTEWTIIQRMEGRAWRRTWQTGRALNFGDIYINPVCELAEALKGSLLECGVIEQPMK